MQRKKNAGAKNRLLPMLIIVKDTKFGKKSIMLTIPSPCIAPMNLTLLKVERKKSQLVTRGIFDWYGRCINSCIAHFVDQSPEYRQQSY